VSQVKCGCCGKEIGEIAFDKSYTMPDEIWALSESEKKQRAQIGSDLCQLDGRYFLRGVAYIPVNGAEQQFGWGIWAEIPQDDFFEYVKNYKEDNSNKPAFRGKVANQIPSYANTIGLGLLVQLSNETQRPTFTFIDESHLLKKEQSEGMSLERVHSFSNKQS
jgi:hypothetical protein